MTTTQTTLKGETMNNSQLKRHIEKAGNVKIKVSNNKCCGWEGWADAYPADAECFTLNGRTFYKGPQAEAASSHGCRTRMDATTQALIHLAERLGVALDESVYGISNARRKADFDARTA